MPTSYSLPQIQLCRHPILSNSNILFSTINETMSTSYSLRGWLREIGKEDGEEFRYCGGGYEDGDHIVFHCEKLWRPESKMSSGAKWRTWEDLDDKRWIVLVPKFGGKEGQMEE